MTATEVWRHELETERGMKDEFMVRDPESPFAVGRVPFHALRYFPPDVRLVVKAKLERLASPQEAYLRTNRDNQAVMRYLGDLTFSARGEDLRLRLYHAGEGVGTAVFVPFRDRTSGKESYGAGRYLTLELNESDVYELDFNRAFNPYCAYTDDFECAFPPPENDLPVAIDAGEMAWVSDALPGTPGDSVPRRKGPTVTRTKPAASRGVRRARRPATGGQTRRRPR